MHEHLQSVESYADRLEFNSERLRNIAIMHSRGEKALARGWGSVLMPDKETYIKSPELIDSSQTPYETLLLLVSPEFLGTHERCDPDDHIPTGEEPKRGYEGIDYSPGWDGSPLACACFAVCKENEIIESSIYPDIHKRLLEHLGNLGVAGVAAAVLDLDQKDYGNIGILDGHHRRKYAVEGPIKLKYVPIQIIPYLYDGSVVLRTWHADNEYWNAEQVFACFKDPEKNADAKKTKFGVIGKDGVIRRILNTQPYITIPLEDLI